MNKGEPLKIKINNLQGALNRDKFEFLPKPELLQRKIQGVMPKRQNICSKSFPNQLIQIVHKVLCQLLVKVALHNL